MLALHFGNMDTQNTLDYFIHHPRTSALLMVLGVGFHWMEALTVDMVYDYTFKGLSLFSLVLVVIANWHKAKESLKKKRSKKNGNED